MCVLNDESINIMHIYMYYINIRICKYFIGLKNHKFSTCLHVCVLYIYIYILSQIEIRIWMELDNIYNI